MNITRAQCAMHNHVIRMGLGEKTVSHIHTVWAGCVTNRDGRTPGPIIRSFARTNIGYARKLSDVPPLFHPLLRYIASSQTLLVCLFRSLLMVSLMMWLWRERAGHTVVLVCMPQLLQQCTKKQSVLLN